MQTIKNASLLSLIILSMTTLSPAQTSTQKKEGKYIIPYNLGTVVDKKTPSFTIDVAYDSVEDKRFILTINNPGKNKLKISLQYGLAGEIFRKDITDSLY